MKVKFDCLKDFEDIRSNCLFCKNQLNFVFTNWYEVHKPGLPLINAEIEKNNFNFSVKYNSLTSKINNYLNIDTLTNVVKFRHNPENIIDFLQILTGFHPHLELQCNNKKCKMNYYICSDTLQFDVYQSSNMAIPAYEMDIINDGYVKIKPCHLYMECFTIKKFWVQSSYIDETLYISSMFGLLVDKISMPQIDFTDLKKEQIVNKIKTFINFS